MPLFGADRFQSVLPMRFRARLAPVRSYPSYIKIIFPVGLLPLVPVGTGLIHASFNLVILILAFRMDGRLWGIVLLPVLLVPGRAAGRGLSWFLAAWGYSSGRQTRSCRCSVRDVSVPFTGVLPNLRGTNFTCGHSIYIIRWHSDRGVSRGNPCPAVG